MKRFVKKIVIFVLVIISYQTIFILYAVNLFPEKHKENQFFGEKKYKINSIILVGSSNLDCNFDYRFLNKYYDDYNIIGCNLNEPSGLFATIYKLKKLKLTKHDKIVLCFPHSFYEKAKFLPVQNSMKRGFSREMLFNAFTSFPYLTLQNFLTMSPSDLLSMPLKSIYDKSYPNLVFEKSPLNQSDPRYNNCWTNDEDKFEIYSAGFEKKYLLDIQSWMDDEFEGEVFYRFPEIREGEYELDDERINFLSDNFHFINEFKNSTYSKDLWFDQWYHLNKCGRDLNTEKLISELNVELF